MNTTITRSARRAPDLNAPRYKKSNYRIVNDDFIEEFLKEHPEYKEVKEIKNVSSTIRLAKSLNTYLHNHVINFRDGIDLPERLGVVFIGSLKSKRNPIDYSLSQAHNQEIRNVNLETNNFWPKIFYSKHSRNHGVTVGSIWSFYGARMFTRAVSKAFKKDYNKYRRIDNKFKIEQLFRERKGYASRDINVPNTYNEFE
jgi:hypothetical protein